MGLPTDANESEIFGEPSTTSGELEMQHQFALCYPLDHRAVVWARSQRFVSAPDSGARGIDSPSATLTIAALGLIARRHRVLIRAVGPVSCRDNHFPAPELPRCRSRRLLVPSEKSLR